MNTLLVLPVMLPLGASIAALFAAGGSRAQRRIAVLGSASLLGVGVALLRAVYRDGILAVQIGGWPAPFGITFAADLFAAIMVLLAGVMGLLAVVYSIGSIDRGREAHGYYPLVLTLLGGVCGVFLTGDLFNLFVWFEVMLIVSFVLLALGGERAQLEGAIKYVVLNLVSSMLLLTAIGLLYGIAGTLNFADLAAKLNDGERPAVVSATALLLLVAFGIKAAVFPLFFWLPASYHTPPPAVTALFAALLSKVGVYALIRMFTLIFVGDVGYTHALLLVIAGLTMVTGVLGALAQTEMRRLLSFHIVSQIGYLVMGLALFTPLALLGTVFFMAHIVMTKSALFMVAGVARRVGGSSRLGEIGGLYDRQPALAALFLVLALSLAGIPPFSGFFAKLALVRAGLEIGQYAIVAVAVGVSVITLYSMIKIWMQAFWEPAPSAPTAPPEPNPARLSPTADRAAMLAPIAVLAVLVTGLGLAAGPVSALAERAAAQLADPRLYIQAVLGTQQ